MQRLGHVYNNFLFSMQKPFLTGLRLKNSLSGALVLCLLFRKSFNPEMGEMLNGIIVDRLSTLTVTLDTLGISPDS